MTEFALLLLAEGRGDDPSGIAGVLIIIGVVLLAAATIAGGAWMLIRRSHRPEHRTGVDEGPQPPRRVGRARGSG